MRLNNPLEIPEIANMVVSYLEEEDFAGRIRVSKGWHDIFLPHLWRVIAFGFGNSETLGRRVYFGPNRNGVYKHRHLIQDLALVNKLDGLDKYDYPKVRRLELDTSYSQSLTKCTAMDFIKLTPLPVDLELTSVDTNQTFWERLSDHPHLRTLALLKMRLETHVTPGLWKTCTKLESLEHVEIEDEGRPRNMVFDRMRNLAMTSTSLQNASPKHDGRQIANQDTHVSWSIFANATMRVWRDIDTKDESKGCVSGNLVLWESRRSEKPISHAIAGSPIERPTHVYGDRVQDANCKIQRNGR